MIAQTKKQSLKNIITDEIGQRKGFFRYLVNWTAKYLRDREDAESFVNYHFFMMSEIADKYSYEIDEEIGFQDPKLKAYFSTVFYHNLLDTLRKQKRRKEVNIDEEQFPLFDSINSRQRTPYEKIESKEEYQRLLKLIHENDSDRFLTLHKFKGKSYEEISEMFDIPLGTVKSKIYGARQRIKKQLELEKA